MVLFWVKGKFGDGNAMCKRGHSTEAFETPSVPALQQGKQAQWHPIPQHMDAILQILSGSASCVSLLLHKPLPAATDKSRNYLFPCWHMLQLLLFLVEH